MAMKLRDAALVMVSVLCCAYSNVSYAQVGPPTSSTVTPTREAKEEAQRRFEQGKELYEENDFRGALIEFRRAYQLAPNFKLLYTIAQVYYQLQDYAAALQTFEKYLADGGREVPAARKTEVERELERLKTRVARVELTTNVAGAEVSVDDVDIGTTPLSKPVLLSAGRRKISVTARGKVPVTRIVDLAGGDSTRLRIELQESDATAAGAGTQGQASRAPAEGAARVEAAPERGKAPWIAWGITGALAAGTAVTGVLALQASGELADKRGTPNVGADALEQARSKTTTLALVTDVLGAATAVAGGVSLYLSLRKVESPAAPASLQVGLGAGMLRVGGSF